MKSMNARVSGFTLMEVMITVAIIAILAAVALPNYFDYVTRSKITEAKTDLADMRTRLEQYFLDNRSYPGACIPPAAGAAPAGNIYLPAATKFFNVTCAFTLVPPGYLVTASGNATGGMTGFGYTVDQANTRTTTGTGSWGRTSTTCWVSRKNGDC